MISKEQAMYSAMGKLEDALVDVLPRIRDRVCELEDPPSYLDISIEISGRTLDGDLEVKFKFDSGNYGKATSGGNFASVFDEYLRRHGWTKRNEPLCLPKVKVDEEEDA